MASIIKTAIPGESIPGNAIPGNIDLYINPTSFDDSYVSNPTITVTASASSITSGEVFSTDALFGEGAYDVGDIASQQIIRNGTVIEEVALLSGLPSLETFGSTYVALSARQTNSIPSKIAFGVPTTEETVLTPSISSYAVPEPVVATQIIFSSGIPSGETFGTSVASYLIGNLSFFNTPYFTDSVIETYEVINVGGIDQSAIGQPEVAETNISVEVIRFSSTLWQAINVKEQYCYNTSDGQSAYQPFFVALSDALTSWINQDRTEEVRNFINHIYSYHMFHILYGTDGSLDPKINADNIFSITATDPSDSSIKSYITKVENAVDSYYADYVAPTSTTNPDGTTTTTPAKAPNLQNDTQMIQGAYGYETSLVSSLQTQMQNATSHELFNLLFDDVPQQGTVTKHDMGHYVFDTLNYEKYFDSLVINLDVPTYINN